MAIFTQSMIYKVDIGNIYSNAIFYFSFSIFTYLEPTYVYSTLGVLLPIFVLEDPG